MEASVAQSLPFNSVQFEVLSSRLESSFIAWKYLEHLLTKYSHKDDLIQLLGYYQYKRAFSVRAEVQPKVKESSPEWKVWEHVSRGLGVGVVIESSALEELYDMPSKNIEKSLRHLKGVGFEIRSHRTNKQIPKDSYLIPYPFPTLNNRSLQGLTEL
jgi:DNA (cytosine-5)-methyltransferase 1